MSDAWDKAEEKAKDASKSDKYVRLEDDGDKVLGVFCGDPHTRELYYDNVKKRYEDYTDEHRKAGKDSSFRASLNLLVYAEGNGEKMEELPAAKMKIIEGGVKWFKSVLKMKKKFGLEGKMFEIERSGKKGDTKTTYSILPERDLTEEEKKTIRTLDLLNLAESVGGSSDSESASDGDDDFGSYDKSKEDPDGAIDTEAADELTGRLRKLPREDIDSFLSKFGVKRVKEVKKKDLDDARAFIAQLEKGGDEEVDPFA